MKFRHGIPVLAMLVLAACAPQEVLVPKSAVVPAGTDLSGRWRLREEQTNDELAAAERRAAAAGGVPIPKSSRNAEPEPGSKPNRDSLVHVFLETGTTLKITQTEHGLFVSFDRAVVEEYRFGENRLVSVGPVEASRVSGWAEDGYVIETLDRKGNKLVEHYALEDDGRVLTRRVAIFRKGKPGLSIVQAYDRL